MKAAWSMVSGLAVACVLALGLQADDGKKPEKAKEETLKGSITCAKCDLKKADKCATVIKVTKDGKDTVYYFDAKSDKDNHQEICRAAKKGSVTGTVSEKDGKKIVTVTKLEFDDKDKK
jgi:hypothetical protein